MTEKKTAVRPGLDIAVIGMTGRFPGARHIKELWENVIRGRESISFFTRPELEDSVNRPAQLNSPQYVSAKGILEEAEHFDAAFFGYSPREAEKMDPQMRVFHQSVWLALEDAGYNPDTFPGSIGLYGGATNNAMWEVMNVITELGNASGTMAAFQLSDKDHMNTRIAYKLNLTGPSFTMETQCSTSLVAVHLACQGLLSGECDMALAGGISIALPQISGYLYQEGMILSPDGHCRAFAARANGTVFGSAAAVVVLKRIEDALEAGDHIYAVIKGSAINNDGSRKAGYTAPSVEGQADVIRAALQVSEVEPESIGYLETHGTGTTLGDPIEVEALSLAFAGGAAAKKGFCCIGSLKPNVGHLDNAAGISSLIKAILVLNHQLIPPALHFEAPNPKIDFENSPFLVNREVTPWTSDVFPLRAGVSSFGIGGTNAHVILEEAPGRDDRGQAGQGSKGRSCQLLLVSARTSAALERMTTHLADYLQENPGLNLADAAYTLQAGRKHFQHRRMLVCSSWQEAVAGLSSPPADDVTAMDTRGRKPPLILMCPPLEAGVSADYRRMAEELYPGESQFRLQVDHCFEILFPGRRVAIGDVKAEDPPVMFVFQYALARLFLHWGIEPKEIIGHGLGKITADCLRGDISLQEALRQVSSAGNAPAASAPGPEFTACIAGGLKLPGTLFLEAGPESGLIGFVKKHSGVTPEHRFITLLERPAAQPQRGFYQRCLLSRLGWLWLCGAAPDWESFRETESRQRVVLPGYSFDMQSFKLDSKKILQRLQQESKESERLKKKEKIEEWFYTPSWERRFFKPGLEISPGETWLLFMDECGLGTALLEHLEKETRCPRLITVRAGNGFKQISEGSYMIDPGQADHYSELVEQLKQQDSIPGKMLHLWGISPDESPEVKPDHVQRYQQAGFYSLLRLVRALGKAGINTPLQMEVVTNQMQDVLGTEQVNPLKVTALGAVKVIPLEYPQIRCRSIDILLPDPLHPRHQGNGAPGTPDQANPGSGLDETGSRLLAEVGRPADGQAVAFRGKHRWVQTLAATALEKPQAPAPPVFKPRGVYLISGGLGGMGYTFALYLAEHFQARLILTGRTVFPGDERGEQNREKIRQLEQLGADVLALSADAANRQQMQAVIRQAVERFERIDGIIHAAGVADYGGIIQRRSEEISQQVLAPKVLGTLILEELLKEEKIEPGFMVLCSSVSALNAPFGEVAYTAANAFLDAFAHYRNSRQQGRTISINWGPWQDVGMAVEALKRKAAKPEEANSRLSHAISPREGCEALTHALYSGFPQVAVSPQDLEVLVEQAQTQQKTAPEPQRSRPQVSRPELTTPYVAPGDEIEEKLVNLWKEFLGVDRVGIHDNFFELGATSLDLVQMNEKINQTFDSQIPVVDLFENPSIHTLVRKLSRGNDEQDDPAGPGGRSEQVREGKRLIQKRLRKRTKENEPRE